MSNKRSGPVLRHAPHALLLSLFTLAACASGQAGSNPPPQPDPLPFPAAKAGQVRWVIEPPADALPAGAAQRGPLAPPVRIEIIAGKTMTVDCNTHFMEGKLVEKTLEGWGYRYFQFETRGQVGATMMACPESAAREDFVAARSHTVEYLPALPLVVYTPAGYSVRYRVWQAPTQPRQALAR